MSTTNLSITLNVTGQETLAEADAPGAAADSDRTIRTGNFNLSASLDSTTTPAVEKAPVQIELTIGASAEVYDLTTIDVAIGRTEDMTGKRLVAYLFAASSSNTGAVTIQSDGTNGYDLFGPSGLIVLRPGQTLASGISGVASGIEAVAAADKRINISGTQNDVIQIAMYFGT